MLRKPYLSIVVVTDRAVLRGDFCSPKSPQLVRFASYDRPAETKPADAVELALSGGRFAKRILVLTTAAWTQTLFIDGQNAETLDAKELSQTLKFEVESFSGISAFDAEVGHVSLDRSRQDREFWVTEVERTMLAGITQAVQSRRAKLVGVAHPAGLPANTVGGEGGAWRRTEFWSEFVCCASGGSAGTGVFLVNCSPKSERWRVGLANWCDRRPEEAEDSHTLVAPHVNVPADFIDGAAHSLDNEDVARSWLTGWASVYSRSPASLPIVSPVAKSTSQRTHKTRAAMAAAAVFIGCLAHWSYLSRATSTFLADAEALQEPAQQARKLQAQVAQIEDEQTVLQKELLNARGDSQAIHAFTESHRDRLGGLLKALANSRPPSVVVSNIKSTNEGIDISGTSLSADGATSLASALRPGLREIGWSVAPPTQKGQDQLVNGGPWTFTIELRAVPPQPSLPPSQVVTPGDVSGSFSS